MNFLALTKQEARERVEEVANMCELTALLDRPTYALSGGEKTRAALAGVLAMDPVYLIVDEITDSLDPWIQAQVIGILHRWVKRGRTVVLATHDLDLARDWAQRVIWIDKGHIYRHGTAEVVFGEQEIAQKEPGYDR